MTTLTAPIPGESESQASDHNECGRLNAEAVVQIVLPGASFWVPDGATAPDMINAIASACPGAQMQSYNDNAVNLLQTWLHQGWYLIAQVQCDGNANPVPLGTASAWHWITLWSDGDPADYYQCWTSQQRQISLNDLAAASAAGTIHYHVLVQLPGSSQVVNTQPTTGQQVSQENDMGQTGSIIQVQRGGNRIDVYQLSGSGDVWHKWPQPGAPAGEGNERIGQNGGTGPTGLVPPSQNGSISGLYDPSTGTTTILGIRNGDGLVWQAQQGDAGTTWVTRILP